MSADPARRCPVCDSPVTYSNDYLDGHTLLESTADCPACHWSYSFAYGGTEEVIGYVLYQWSWPENPGEWQTIRDEMLAAMPEARRLARDPEARAFGRAVRDNPDDRTAWAVFSDWLGDNGYPLNERAARERSAWAGEPAAG
jgi:uncharacterized protein (TIGR02996 family)